MSPRKRDAKKQAKARHRRRLQAQERLERDRRQAQHAAQVGPGVAKVNFLAKLTMSFSPNGAMKRNGVSCALISVGEMGHRTILLRLSAVLRNAVVMCRPLITPD